jgi:hypothetical protein
VLVAEFHSDGGPYIMNAQGHTEFVDAFHSIGQDRANKIVRMTGAGGNGASLPEPASTNRLVPERVASCGKSVTDYRSKERHRPTW